MATRVSITVLMTTVTDDRVVTQGAPRAYFGYTPATAERLNDEISDAVQEFEDEMLRCQLRNEHPFDPRAEAGGFDVGVWGDFEARM